MSSATRCGSVSRGTARPVPRRRSPSSWRSRRPSTRQRPTSTAIEVVEPENVPGSGPPQIAGLVALPMVSASTRSGTARSASPRITVGRVGHARRARVPCQQRQRAQDHGRWRHRPDRPDRATCSTRTWRSVPHARVAWRLRPWTVRCWSVTAARARYDIRRAGAGIGSDFRIEPLPLLEDSGVLRIAIPAPAGMSSDRSPPRTCEAHPRARARRTLRAVQRGVRRRIRTTSTSSSRRRGRSAAAARRARSFSRRTPRSAIAASRDGCCT